MLKATARDKVQDGFEATLTWKNFVPTHFSGFDFLFSIYFSIEMCKKKIHYNLEVLKKEILINKKWRNGKRTSPIEPIYKSG